MDSHDDPLPSLDPTLAHGAAPSRTHPAPFDAESTLVQTPAEAAALLGAPDLTQVPPAGNPHATQPAGGQIGGEPVDMTLVGGNAAPSAAAPVHKVPGTRFEILGVLGQGGMGKVFRARDLQIEGRQVALKVLHPQYSQDSRFRELFFQEIRAAQGFVSPHAVQIRDTGLMPDGALFLTMDLVAGESLSRKLRREGSLAPQHAFEIGRQILLGLHSGHEQGLVHRDVKPSNVMLAARVPKTPDNPFGVGVRLLDFGIAGLIQEQREGTRTGTPRYMSPEQVQGQRLDARSDLFAVGVVLYEMLTGTRPFDGETLDEVETSILETQIEPLIRDLDGLPRAVRKILAKALRKDREKRFQTANEFVEALERAHVLEPAGRLGLLPKVGLVVLATLAGAEATVIVHQRGELADGETVDGEEVASLELRLTQRETELTRLQERISDEGDLGTRFVDLQRDYNKLADDNGTLQRRNEELERRTAELGNARFEEQPSAKAAACFDEVLRRIDHDLGRSTVEFLAERAGAGVFALEGVDGSVLIHSLAACAAALESARKDDGVDLSQLGTAEVLLEEVRAGEQDFVLEASGWLSVVPAGGAPVDRRAGLAATIVHLEETLAALHEQGASSQERAWREVAAGADDQDPEAAFAYAELYGVETIDELVGRYSAHLERTTVVDGWLDVDELAKSEALIKWSVWLLGPGTELSDAGANMIRGFATARSWYVERAEQPVFAELLGDLPEVVLEDPHHDWRTQLALQIALARTDAYPLSPECSVVMRHTWLQSGASMWFLERLEERTAQGWKVERRIHNVSGETTGRPQSYGVTRLQDAFFVEGTKGLDLRGADSNVRVASLRLENAESLPERPWVRDLDLPGYIEAVRSGPIPCLVVRTGSTEMWFSPRFGLVRESRDGVYSRQQVFYSDFR